MREDAQGQCWHCGQTLNAADYLREARCPGCQRATHCCRNCRFYSPGRHNDCSEPVAERVTDKDRANFCDYFEPAGDTHDGVNRTGADDLLKAAEDLFK